MKTSKRISNKLYSLRLDELHVLARNMNIKGFSKLSKQSIINKLEQQPKRKLCKQLKYGWWQIYRNFPLSIKIVLWFVGALVIPITLNILHTRQVEDLRTYIDQRLSDSNKELLQELMKKEEPSSIEGDEQIYDLQIEVTPSYRAQKFASEVSDTAGWFEKTLKAIAEQRYNDARNNVLQVELKTEEDSLVIFLLNGLLEDYSGHYNIAARFYKEALKYMPKEPYLLKRTAATLENLGDYENAIKLMETGINIEVQRKEIEYLDLARDYNKLGGMYYKFHNFALAESLYLEAKSIIIENYGQDCIELSVVLNNLGLLHLEQHKYSQSLSELQQGLDINERQFKPDDIGTASILNNMALVLFEMKLCDEAIPLCKRSISIKDSILGPKHTRVALSWNALGALYHCLGEEYYEFADSAYTTALNIRQERLGPDHPDVAITLSNLAVLRNDQGQYEDAEDMIFEALHIFKLSFSEDHPRTAKFYGNIAAIYRDQDRFGESEHYYKKTINIYIKEMPKSIEIANTYGGYAKLLDKLERFEEAEEMRSIKEAIYKSHFR